MKVLIFSHLGMNDLRRNERYPEGNYAWLMTTRDCKGICQVNETIQAGI